MPAGLLALVQASTAYAAPMDEPVMQSMERFRRDRGALFAERRNRAYTLYRSDSGARVARLRPAGADGSFEMLYWSLSKNRWTSTGTFGRTVMPVDDALRFIAARIFFGSSGDAQPYENAESRVERAFGNWVIA